MNQINDNIKSEFIVDLINNYVNYFNKINKKQKLTLFDGINFDDPTSTNKQIEEFYIEFEKYKVWETTNKDFIEIYKYEDISDKGFLVDSDDLYCILNNGDPMYVSKSLFSLLIELTNLKNECKNEKENVFEVINLK